MKVGRIKEYLYTQTLQSSRLCDPLITLILITLKTVGFLDPQVGTSMWDTPPTFIPPFQPFENLDPEPSTPQPLYPGTPRP